MKSFDWMIISLRLSLSVQFFFMQSGGTPASMELQEKKDIDKNHIEKLIRKSTQIKGAY